ncbi:MAG: EamA family transporter [Bacillota bacterium]|nr:EamA family transporter [Bacillota bacterium]
MDNKKEIKGYIQVAIAGILWGLVGIFTMTLSNLGVSSVLASFLRIGFAFVVILVMTLAVCGVKSLKISFRTFVGCFVAGVLCHGIYNLFYLTAVVKMGVTPASVMLRTAPIFTVAASVIIFREHISRIKGLSLTLNIIGCTMAVVGGTTLNGSFNISGLLCGLGAGCTYGLLAIVIKLIPANVHSLVISTYSYFFAAVLLCAVAKPWEHAEILSFKIMITGFAFGLIATAAAYGVYYAGIQKIKESSRVPIFASVEIIAAAFTGVVFCGDYLNVFNLVGIIMILVSVIILCIQPKAIDKG